MIAGITGHRMLSETHWVKLMMQQIVEEMRISYGFTCLAKGADELFAEVLMQSRINYTAIIPCANYEETFEGSALQDFKYAKKKAQRIIEMSNKEPSEKAFNEAGKFVVDSSEILIAVWDGEGAKGLGGTADIVEYADSKKKKIIHLNPVTQTQTKINHGE